MLVGTFTILSMERCKKRAKAGVLRQYQTPKKNFEAWPFYTFVQHGKLA